MKFSDGMKKLEQFVEEMGALDHQAVYTEETKKLEKALNENDRKQLIDPAEVGEIIEVFRKWYEDFLIEWDRVLEVNVVEAIKHGHKKKLQLELGIYNFSDQSIPEASKEILKLGKKSVPIVNKGVEAALTKFDDELYQYLLKYRKQVQRRPQVEVPDSNVKNWL